MDRVESDMPTRQTIETLVELSVDWLDTIAWNLSELLDRLAKVSATLYNTNRNVMGHLFSSKSTRILVILL